MNCEIFASTIGSTSHNSLFLRDDAEAIFIPRALNNFNNYQGCCNQVHSVNAIYIDSTFSIYYKAAFNVFYLLSPQLKRFFGDKFDGYDEYDFKNFLLYVKSSVRKGAEVNQDLLTKYISALPDFMPQLKQCEDLIKACDMPTQWETFQPPIPEGLIYSTHVHEKGWGTWQKENSISNAIDKNLDIQAIKIKYPGHKIYYSIYYGDKEGWSKEVYNGEMAGTTGKGKPIYGMRVRLDEMGARVSDILYRMHKLDDTWTPWAKNGEIIYSYGQKLNAIQIKLEDKSDATKA